MAKGFEVLRLKIDNVNKDNPIVIDAEVDLLANELTNLKIYSDDGGVQLHEKEVFPLAEALLEIAEELESKGNLRLWKKNIVIKKKDEKA